MKWTYFLQQKLKVAMALAMVLVLVILTNIADQHYFSSLHTSITSVYKDRLVVEGYIFRLSNILHDRLQASGLDTTRADPKQFEGEIESILADYKKTVFTEKESEVFGALTRELGALTRLESEDAGDRQGTRPATQIARKHQELAELLRSLSAIQIEEGRTQIAKSERIVASSYFLSRIEIVVIIVVGLVVQVLVMTSRSSVSGFPQNDRLN